MANYTSTHTGAQIDSMTGYAVCFDNSTALTANIAAENSKFALTAGACLTIKFTYAVQAGSTLNINGTGVKAIYYRGNAIVANVIAAGDTVTFTYDGSYYHVISVGLTATFSGSTLIFN